MADRLLYVRLVISFLSELNLPPAPYADIKFFQIVPQGTSTISAESECAVVGLKDVRKGLLLDISKMCASSPVVKQRSFFSKDRSEVVQYAEIKINFPLPKGKLATICYLRCGARANRTY